jgi:hypothetical protein
MPSVHLVNAVGSLVISDEILDYLCRKTQQKTLELYRAYAQNNLTSAL